MFSNIVFKKALIAVSIGALFSLGAVFATKGSAAPVDGASESEKGVVYDTPNAGKIDAEFAEDLAEISRTQGKGLEETLSKAEGQIEFSFLVQQISDEYPKSFVNAEWGVFDDAPGGKIVFSDEVDGHVRSLIEESGINVDVKILPNALTEIQREELAYTISSEIGKRIKTEGNVVHIEPEIDVINVTVSTKESNSEDVVAAVNTITDSKLPVKVFIQKGGEVFTQVPLPVLGQ